MENKNTIRHIETYTDTNSHRNTNILSNIQTPKIQTYKYRHTQTLIYVMEDEPKI